MLRYQVRILRTIFPKPVMFCSGVAASEPVEEKKQISLFQKLSREFNDISPIKKILKDDEMKNLHFEEWSSRIYLLKRYHFTNFQCFQMIAQYPSLLQIPLSKFEKTIGQWFCADLGMKNFQEVLLKQPVLLDIDAEVIKKRLPRLRTFFRTSSALAELLINSPNVMLDNSNSVFNTLDYLLNDRRFTVGEISQAGALSKSLHHIKFRLDLLEKCGIYKTEKLPVHKINQYDKSKHKNPNLMDILSTSVQDFAKLAKISVEEYNVCRDLFMESENDEDDSDDEVPYLKQK